MSSALAPLAGRLNRRAFLAAAACGASALVAACHDTTAPDYREPGARLFSRRRSPIALLGFSAGASEALGLGLLNGDLFSSVVGFSPTMIYAPFARGHPRAFVSHGTGDADPPYETTRDVIVPAIKALGVPVQFSSFDGGHTVPVSVAREALGLVVAN